MARAATTTLWLVALLPSACLAQAPASATAPFALLKTGDRISGHIVVQVKLNGKGPYRMIFDTGAPMNIINLAAGRECGLLAPGVKRPVQASPLTGANFVLADRLEIGSLTASEQPIAVMEHPTIRTMAESYGPIDGLIGFPLFARYRTTIDYQALRLTFVPTGYQPADVFQEMVKAMFAGAGRGKAATPPVLAPAGVWGLRVEKSDATVEPGVTINTVFPDSPAARAGLQKGDRVLTVNGRWTDSVEDFFRVAASISAGQTAEIKRVRNGRESTVRLAPTVGF